jgi:hypothetical protein
VGLHRIQTMVAELALRHDSIVLAKIVELGYIEKVGGCIIGSLRHYSGSRDRDAHTDWMLRCLNLYYLLFSKCDEIRINADIAQLMTDIITHFLTISKPSRQLE